MAKDKSVAMGAVPDAKVVKPKAKKVEKPMPDMVAVVATLKSAAGSLSTAALQMPRKGPKRAASRLVKRILAYCESLK